MPAWSEAKRSGAEARRRATATGGDPDTPDLEALLKSWLMGKKRDYDFSKTKCVFCGARGHHTGVLPIVGSVWVCKERCRGKYEEARRER